MVYKITVFMMWSEVIVVTLRSKVIVVTMWWKIRQTNIWHELRLLKQSSPLFAMQALRGRGGTVPTHSWPRHYIGVNG
jgi:hypothetical protein